MEDSQIVQLYWDRNQEAISATSKKYGGYCTSIAKNILGNNEDAEECVNDTYLIAWNSMPPNRPSQLSTYLGKITRNLSFNRYKYNTAGKRCGEIQVVLDELNDCVLAEDNTQQEFDQQELTDAINTFLSTLPKKKRGTA